MLLRHEENMTLMTTTTKYIIFIDNADPPPPTAPALSQRASLHDDGVNKIKITSRRFFEQLAL